METGAYAPEPINRIGLLFGCLAIMSLVLETQYESAKIANIAFNLIACLILQRGKRGRLWRRLSLTVTLLGVVVTAMIVEPATFPGPDDLVPLAFSSGWSTFFIMVYFGTLGRADNASPSGGTAGKARKVPHWFTPNVCSALMLIGGVLTLFISGATQIDAVSGFAVPLLLGAPLVFVYGLARGITQAAKRSSRSEDSDSELPVL